MQSAAETTRIPSTTVSRPTVLVSLTRPNGLRWVVPWRVQTSMPARGQPSNPWRALAEGPEIAPAGTDNVAAMHWRNQVPGCDGKA